MSRTVYVRLRGYVGEAGEWPDAIFGSYEGLLNSVKGFTVTSTITKTGEPCHWKDSGWAYSYEEVDYFD